MRLIEVEQKLLALKQPILQTSDVSVCLKINNAHASKMLSRLVSAGKFVRLMRGKWAVNNQLDPLILPEYLTSPFPTYISLQTALFYHGMISQIPNTIYAVTLARTRSYKTPLATISAHHMDPEFFFGFESVGNDHVKMALPEKALLDFLYLTPVKSKLFKTLPEVELPINFDRKKAYQIIKKIPSLRLQTVVTRKLQYLLKQTS